MYGLICQAFFIPALQSVVALDIWPGKVVVGIANCWKFCRYGGLCSAAARSVSSSVAIDHMTSASALRLCLP